MYTNKPKPMAAIYSMATPGSTHEMRLRALQDHIVMTTEAHRMIQKCEAGVEFSEQDYAAAVVTFFGTLFQHIHPIFGMPDELHLGSVIPEKAAELGVPSIMKFGAVFKWDNGLIEPYVTKCCPTTRRLDGLPNPGDIITGIQTAFPGAKITHSRDYSTPKAGEHPVPLYHVTARAEYCPEDGLIAVEGSATCSNMSVAYMQAGVRLLHNFLVSALCGELLADRAGLTDTLAKVFNGGDVKSRKSDFYGQLHKGLSTDRQTAKREMLSKLYTEGPFPTEEKRSEALDKIMSGLARRRARDAMLTDLANAFGLRLPNSHFGLDGKPVNRDLGESLARSRFFRPGPGRVMYESNPSPDNWTVPKFLSPSWTPGEAKQAEDRLHRRKPTAHNPAFSAPYGEPVKDASGKVIPPEVAAIVRDLGLDPSNVTVILDDGNGKEYGDTNWDASRYRK